MSPGRFIEARLAEMERAAQRAGDYRGRETPYRNDNYGILNVQASHVLAQVAALRNVVRILEGMGGHWNPDANRQSREALAKIAGIWAEKFDQLAAFQNFQYKTERFGYL